MPTDSTGGPPAAGPVGDFLTDGAAIRRALALIAQQTGAPLRMTSLTAAAAGQYSLLTVDVRNSSDPLAIDRYNVNLQGQVSGPTQGSISNLLASGQQQLTRAGVDAKTFTTAQLPIGHWSQMSAQILARTKIRGGAVTAWAAMIQPDQLRVIVAVSSRYGSSGVIADDKGRIVSVT